MHHMFLNSYLLSIFIKNKPFEGNINPLAIHYQILSIFYVGFVLTTLITTFEIINCTCLEASCNYPLTAISNFGFILCVIALKLGHRTAAGAIVMIYLHCVNMTGGLAQNLPLSAIVACFSYLNYCYFLTKSSTIVAVNSLVSVGELFLYIKRITQTFHGTLTPEQMVQAMSALVALIFVFMIVSVLTFIQKNIESNLWGLLNENYKKSENLTKEVVQLINAKDSFVSSLSHEVRNVLNALNGSVDYLLSILKDSPHLQPLKSARMSGEILFNLVSNTLDVAKIQADRLELSYSHANFEDVVKRAFLINSECLKTKNIFAKAFIDSRVPKNLWIDSGRMLQIMMNLMSNALKFTPRGGQIRVDVLWCKEEETYQNLLEPVEDDLFRDTSTTCFLPSIPTINCLQGNPSLENVDESVCEFSIDEEQVHHQNLSRLLSFPSFERTRSKRRSSTILYSSDHCQIQTIDLEASSPKGQFHNENPHESGFLKIQFSDTGCGIPKDCLPKLFEMYFQADYTVSSNCGGTGLGLWICQQLCHKMQGDITVYSQLDVGTKFVFYVPADNVRKNLEGRVVRDKVNALVVDDYDFNRNLHKLLLEREGVQVTVAVNGQEAVQKFKEKGDGYFDFVFMDINMPVLDGFGAAKQIRDWEEKNSRQNIMIYFVSGEYFSDSEVIGGFRNTGAPKQITNMKFLRKPIEVEMVAKIVKDYKDDHAFYKNQ